MTYQAPTTGLHSPTLLPFLQNFAILVSYAGTILEVWSELLLQWLDSPRGLHPSTCASDIWTCPHIPPFTQFAQKGCQSTGLELKIPLKYLKFCRSDPVNFWRGVPSTPRPPPLRLDPYIYQSDSSRRQDSEYINLNQFDKCRLKAPPAIGINICAPLWMKKAASYPAAHRIRAVLFKTK